MNYKKVITAYASGEIDRDKWVLVFDNDDGYWSYNGKDVDDEGRSAMEAEMKKKYGTPDGYGDVVDLAIAAGINAEWC